MASPEGPSHTAPDLGLPLPEHDTPGCGLCDGGPTLSQSTVFIRSHSWSPGSHGPSDVTQAKVTPMWRVPHRQETRPPRRPPAPGHVSEWSQALQLECPRRVRALGTGLAANPARGSGSLLLVVTGESGSTVHANSGSAGSRARRFRAARKGQYDCSRPSGQPLGTGTHRFCRSRAQRSVAVR